MKKRRFPKLAPEKRHVVLPWMASLSIHLGLALVGAFALYTTTTLLADSQQIIIPNSFEDPSYSQHPGGQGGSREMARPNLKDLGKSEGWESSGQNVASLLAAGDVSLFGGSGTAAAVAGQTSDSASAYTGVPGGTGIARSTFYGTGGNATKIIYILDHSGSMLDNFEFLKSQATKSVNNLSANQFFGVILVSDKVTWVGPEQMQRALPESKKEFAGLLQKEVAEGANDGLLTPFEQAFNAAFAREPELIYFLTDGKFGDGLIGKVAALNKDHKVHINTIAFVTEEAQYKGQLQQLAQENGGTYKFVPQKEVGN